MSWWFLWVYDLPMLLFFCWQEENMRNTRTPPMFLLDMNLFSIYLYRKLSYSVHVSNSAHNKLQRENSFFFAP